MVGTAKYTTQPKKSNLGLRIKKYWGFYLMFIPVAIFVIVFHYLPMFGIYFSFGLLLLKRGFWS